MLLVQQSKTGAHYEMKEIDDVGEESDSRQAARAEAMDDTTRSPSPITPLPHPSEEELSINRWVDDWDNRRTKHRWDGEQETVPIEVDDFDTRKRARDDQSIVEDEKSAIERYVQREIAQSAIERFGRVTGLPY